MSLPSGTICESSYATIALRGREQRWSHWDSPLNIENWYPLISKILPLAEDWDVSDNGQQCAWQPAHWNPWGPFFEACEFQISFTEFGCDERSKINWETMTSKSMETLSKQTAKGGQLQRSLQFHSRLRCAVLSALCSLHSPGLVTPSAAEHLRQQHALMSNFLL